MIPVALAAGALFLTGTAHAADLYVSATGNDTNAGKSAASAFRTLKKAADVVEPGGSPQHVDRAPQKPRGTNGSGTMLTLCLRNPKPPGRL